MSGVVPAKIAASFTMAELAALAVIARQCQRGTLPLKKRLENGMKAQRRSGSLVTGVTGESCQSPTAPKGDKAREVLEWCRYGHQKMGSNPTGPDWVLVWAGAITLLRAVGHPSTRRMPKEMDEALTLALTAASCLGTTFPISLEDPS
jgi:hypothetical protein